jgi:DNA-binding transcriptional MerR regulator
MKEGIHIHFLRPYIFGDVKLATSVQLKVRFKSTMKELDIGEVAELSGVPPSTLRFYEKKGLINLIMLGQAAGFTLAEMALMLNTEGRTVIDRKLLEQRARQIDSTIHRLQLLSKGLKHVARCTEHEHTECEEFKMVVARGLRVIR